MTRVISSVALSIAVTSFAAADVGVVEATGGFQMPNAAYPYVSGIGASQNPRLHGFDFGPIDVPNAQSLLLANWYFENYAYNGGSTPPGAASNDNWLDGFSTASLTVTLRAGSAMISNNTYALVQTGVNGNNRFWQLTESARNTNLAGGLGIGSYSVEFSNTFSFNVWTGFVSQGSSTTEVSTATFNVVPAPGAIALFGVAGLVGMRRRR